MNAEAEAADIVVKLVVYGTVYFFKLSTEVLAIPAMKGIGHLVSRALHGEIKTRGSVNMEALIAKEQGISFFLLPEKEMPSFEKVMKKANLSYTIFDSQEGKDVPDRMVTVVGTANAAPLINALIKQNRIHGKELADMESAGKEQAPKQEEQKEAAKEPTEKEASAADPEKANEDFFNAITGVNGEADPQEHPTQEAGSEMSGSQSGTASQKSENVSVDEPLDIENLPSEIEDTHPEERISVRARLNEIKQELAAEGPAPIKERGPQESQMFKDILQKVQGQESPEQ